MNGKQLVALAKKSGIVAAEERALAAGGPVWLATPSGLAGADTRHLLLEGERSYRAITKTRSVMYDPLSDEAVIVTPKRDGVHVRVGSIMLREILAKRRLKTELAATDLLVETYAEGSGEIPVSRWLVDYVSQAALKVINGSPRSGAIMAPSYKGVLPKQPKKVWDELEALSIVQPWGAPVARNPLGCFNPRRRWVKL
jgi:hypothetical protein